MPLSRYIITAALGKSVTGRRDQLRTVQLLTEIERQMESIAAVCRTAASFEQALPALLSLAEIEGAIMQIAGDADRDEVWDDGEGPAC